MGRHGLAGLGLGLLVLAGLPGAAGAQAPALTLPVTAGQLLHVPGETLRLSVTAQNPGLPVVADFYVAVLLPDQETLAALGPGGAVTLGRVDALAALPPVAAGIDLSVPFSVDFTPFFERVWTGPEPEGLYQVFVGAVTAGALGDGVLAPAEILALSTVDFLFTRPFTPALDPGRAASALITPGGGTLVATGGDGVTYTLDVPPGALKDATTLTLTPVTGLAGLPLDQLLAAVRAEPEGLEFLLPVTLSMTLPGAPPAQGLVGFAARGDGAQLQLLPLTPSGATLTFTTTHFSVFGAGLAVPESLSVLGVSTSPLAAACIGESFPTTATLPSCLAWFNQYVFALLVQGLTSDGALLTGLTEFARWRNVTAYFSPVETGPTESVGLDLAADGFVAAIGRANAACTASRSLAFANAAVGIWAFAEGYLPPDFDRAAKGLDLDHFLETLCIHVRIVSTSFPPPPYPPGQPVSLQLQAQIEFATGAPLFAPLSVTFAAQGIAEAPAGGPVDSQGHFATLVTPTGSGPVLLRVFVRVDDPAFPNLYFPVSEIFEVGELIVSPSNATVAPGTTRQFTATLNGQPHPVTWSVSGAVASITSGGLFTAFTPPSLPVIVVVTATSTSNPNLTGTATVTIDNSAALLTVSGNAGASQTTPDCQDSDSAPAGTTFPVTLAVTCPASRAQQTVTRSGNTLTFTGSSSADLGHAGVADATIVILPTAGTFVGTATLNPGSASLSGPDGSCQVKAYATGGGLNVFFIQNTGDAPTSQLSDSVQLSPTQGMNMQIKVTCQDTGSASLSGVSFTMTLSPAP